MSEQELTRSVLNGRTQQPTASNFKGQKPLPAIPYTDSCRKFANPSSSTSVHHGELNVKTASMKNDKTYPDEGFAVCNDCSPDQSASSHSPYKYKWVKSSQRLTQATGKPGIATDLYHSTSSRTGPFFINKLMRTQQTKNLYMRQGASSVSKMSKKDQSPNLLVKNSKCIRQLPPIDMYQYLEECPFRPSCPTPVSPPSSPQEKQPELSDT